MKKDIVLRTVKKKNYKTIDLTATNDSNLSYKAKGIHTYLITRPDNWSFNKTDIYYRATNGRSSIRSGLQELKEKNYLVTNRVRNSDGTLGKSQWIIKENPCMDNPHVENQPVDNDPPNNKYSNNKGEDNNKESNKEIHKESFDKFWKLYDYKMDKPRCEKYWSGKSKLKNGSYMNDTMRKECLSAVPKYVENTYKDKYPTRKHPATYLYNSSWENEVVEIDKDGAYQEDGYESAF